jgi:hypothetical protein
MPGDGIESMPYKIALYGFGSFPVVYRHLVETARAEHSPVEFCLILTAPNWRQVVRDVLPTEDILDLFAELPLEPLGGNQSLLANYDGSLIEDLAALKWERRKHGGRWRRNQGMDIYRLYINFLVNRRATHLLMSNIETPDAKIAVAAARELGLGIMAPADLRNMSGTYFSTDSYETPPAYAASTPEARTRAVKFIRTFRQQASPARSLPSDIDLANDDGTILESYLPGFGARVGGFVKATLERPDLFDHEAIRVSLMRNFSFIRSSLRGLRRKYNEKQYDISHADLLPSRFVYYPLQYTPESSINVPSPYFVDQFRVVDALRFAMPNDCTLIVKEHPACVEMRPSSFMRHMRNLPGVEVAKATIPSNELIQRAALTATVTGTAAFEALLMGRPAIAFGRGLSAWALNGSTPLGNLRDRMQIAITKLAPDDFVVDQIAKLFDARYPFIFTTAHLPGEPMLRRGNIGRFWTAIVDHLARERAAMATAKLDG